MKINKKQVISILLIIFSGVVFFLYNNFQNKKQISSFNADVLNIVKIAENNCEMTTENNKTILEKYNGNADKVIIDKSVILGDTLGIDPKAFLECGNLSSILIDKTIANEKIKIENFEKKDEYIDEKYVEYKTTQQYSESYNQYLNLSEEEKNKIGIIPNKYDIPINAIYTSSMQKNYNVSEIEEKQLPEKFDLRDVIDIKVENQASSPICYAYASLTSVETNLAIVNNDNVDLSESHLASLTYGNAGGGFISADNKYYKEKLGPVYEEEWADTSGELTARRYVKETVSMPSINKSNAYTQNEINTARKLIKTHIMQYGSLYASIYSGIVKNDKGIYVLKSEYANFTDHAISIIGWDDNFAKENFPISNRPKNDGAYLALNSWGQSWGDGGAFWISYEDYWVELALKGVVKVETLEENMMNVENLIIKNKANNEQMLYKIPKGTKAQIEIITNLYETIPNQEQIEINLISPLGEDITSKLEIQENKIENNRSIVVLNLETSELLTGKYKINLKYNEKTISIPIIIKIDTYDFRIKEDGTICITGYYGNEKKIIIPKEFYGYEVTEIEGQAFGINDLDSITIYENIKEIGESIIDKTTIIYGIPNTYVEAYANENDYIFIDINSKKVEGQGWYFDTENSKLVILENNITKEYDYLKKFIKIIEVKNPVQEIFSYQFQGYECLEEIILPDSVQTIGERAFGECVKLQKINIPIGVTVISDSLFYRCNNLKNINIPAGVTSIGNYTFYECINLQNINIPEGITTIGDRAFYRCINLKNFDLPESVVNFGVNVFEESIINNVLEYGLTEMELPKMVKRALTIDDVLNCDSGIKIQNAKINNAKTALEITPGYGQIFITITSGKLYGLKISIIASGVIEYGNIDEWTSEDVTAKLYIGDGEKVINNNGDTVYKFSKNGEFEFEYLNLKGELKKVVAKVENIDNELPAIRTSLNKNEEGFVESITAHISDEESGLWSGSSIGYAWSTSNLTKPTDWTTADIPKFPNGTKEASFEIDISGLSGKYYLWIYKNAFYDMAATGFEKEWELISEEPYYLGNEPIFQEIKISNPPDKTEYVEGQNFDKTGMKVVEVYHNGSEVEIIDYMVIDGENLGLERTFVTIEYNKNGTVYRVTQDISVVEKKIISIEVIEGTVKTQYIEGESFDSTGMQVVAKYNDGTSNEITDYKIIGGENLTIEQNYVTIKYQDIEIHQEINVIEKTIESISIKEKPIKQEYVQNKEELDLNGGIIEILYNNKTKEEISMTSELIKATGFDNSIVGKNKITLTYKNKTVQFEVIIKEATPENSSFENTKGKIKRIRKYSFTDTSKKQYIILDVEISDIVKAKENDKIVYQYYLSSNDNETNISNWIDIENIQETENKLEFEINSLDCINNINVENEKTLYLYLREIATKNDITLEYVTSSIVLEINISTEEFIDGKLKEEELPDEEEVPKEELPEEDIPEEDVPVNPQPEDDKNKPVEPPKQEESSKDNSQLEEKEEIDSSMAGVIYPNAGKSVLAISILVLIIGIGIFTYKKYKNIQIK